jgi:hypothetical protein
MYRYMLQRRLIPQVKDDPGGRPFQQFGTPPLFNEEEK